MNNKKGITLTSLVVYLVLFTIFTVFTMNISTNINESLLNDRGEAINYTNLIKLRTNIEISALNSDDVSINNGVITFSNGDEYQYVENSDTVKKNGGVLLCNITNFSSSIVEGSSVKKLVLNVEFNKYLNRFNAEITSSVEE